MSSATLSASTTTTRPAFACAPPTACPKTSASAAESECWIFWTVCAGLLSESEGMHTLTLLRTRPAGEAYCEYGRRSSTTVGPPLPVVRTSTSSDGVIAVMRCESTSLLLLRLVVELGTVFDRAGDESALEDSERPILLLPRCAANLVTSGIDELAEEGSLMPKDEPELSPAKLE